MGNRWSFVGTVLAMLAIPGFLLAQESIEGWLYSRAGVSVYQADGPQVTPDPAPSGKCETCNGTGRVGDGRVSVTCMDCGGDGIVGNQSLPCNCQDGGICTCEDCGCAPRQELVSVSEPVVVGYQTVCRNGVCTMEPVYDSGSVLSDVGNCADGSCAVSAGVAGAGSAGVCGDGPVRNVVGRVLERQPVRSVVRRVRENQPVRSFIRGLRCR